MRNCAARVRRAMASLYIRPRLDASGIGYRCQRLTQQCYRDIIRPASGIKNERIANESHPTICAFRCAGFVDPCRVQARFGRAAPREGQRIRQPVEVERGGRGVRRFPPSRSVAGRALGAKGICPPAAQAVRRGREGNVEACRYAHRSTEEGGRLPQHRWHVGSTGNGRQGRALLLESRTNRSERRSNPQLERRPHQPSPRLSTKRSNIWTKSSR